jgi:hypothetical protein
MTSLSSACSSTLCPYSYSFAISEEFGILSAVQFSGLQSLHFPVAHLFLPIPIPCTCIFQVEFVKCNCSEQSNH